ncbi:MAG: (2Fe-2S)-binding protein [Alphaproteobacteria bacterium]
MIEVELAVNGERETVSVDATQTLLDVLRTKLGLTGTKIGCNQGVCGSCTVLIDGKPARSCLVLAAGCRGRAIATIEGIGTAEAPSPVQQAFIEAGAVQCGYCTPGMVLAAEALLRKTKRPSVPEIREALSGNLCRCSGYTKIVDAVKLASERAAP